MKIPFTRCLTSLLYGPPGFGIAFALDIVFAMIKKWAAEMIDRMKKKNFR
ncbi:MAG: hypothetical protein LKG90_04050 [Lachnospiraceae bacterium]|jgi:hypothetical protein|nr:hypothetical protein [Lachnospiraceae bacterium]MCH4027591.1 hypothetical protein [Lachnospiraceae bacterium]MCH4065431.1 hypothetical protein [Lachnospiraceae bacterium]MCH4111471.1 hypothetical protein [Lachnospiraceae bacterium]MCI1353067.1 hypothetical protein [Lachnospiraceae bacterium]